MRRPLSLAVVLLALWTCKAKDSTKRILLVPVQMNSHMMEVGHSVSELTKRGYELHMVVSDVTKIPSNILSYGIKALRYKTRNSENPFISDDTIREAVTASITESSEDDLRTCAGMSESIIDDCTEMMADDELVEKVRSMNFDLAVVDGFYLGPCPAILPYNLSIPFVTVGSDFLPTYHGVPALPSFVPNDMTTFSDTMTFRERFQNLITHLMASSPFFPGQTDRTLLTKYGHQDRDYGRMIFELPSEGILSIVNLEPILSHAIPAMPRTIFAGGLSTCDAKPLPNDLERIISDSKYDVILVSFGSIAGLLPEYVTEKFIDAFSRLKYTVIWRYQGDMPRKVSNNVHIRKWLPQNDLLGHPKTKLFITHSGNNGQYEALYHAIPMLGFYIWGDQKHNAHRIERKGFGLTSDLRTCTADELVNKINELLTNIKYHDNIQRASKIYRDQPMTARETSAFWIEHVLKYGSDHLKSGATDLPWYAYLMLDVLLVVAATSMCVFLLVLCVVYLIVCRCKSYIRAEKKKHKDM